MDLEPIEALPQTKECEAGETGDISSLNPLAGPTNPRSLHLLDEIHSHQFQVLIDSGSTHNFIKSNLVEQWGLSIQSTPNFRVFIRNVDFLLYKYVCHQVQLVMQGHVFLVDLFVL